MALSADTVRQYRNLAPIIDLPAVATDILYRGAALEDTSGTADVVSGTGTFIGFAAAKADNSSGAASAIDVGVYPEGEVYLSVAGVTSTDDLGSTVYATDDNTFTLTASGATSIGKISQWVTSTYCWVKFQGAAQRSI
jgi:hypothetical protein